MHELALTQNILDIVCTAATEHGVDRIVSITLKTGVFSGVVPDYLREYFPIAAKGTLAENAELIVIPIPAKIRCRVCGAEAEVDKSQTGCPSCSSKNVEIIGGREFYVDSIEAE